ncbi:hypothetical protein [Nitrosopumilus sp.]|uniref:cupredoxin domain-containing protein n=1 Tax=Nitrosopumilus sp. TaxID=2024843 RepID=UPI00247CB40C|nr:hypothetical protein [Nitrosopumilus sp.]MCV0409652.1 hypothetical protein [Nitrosopumilus sp.]
MKTKFLIIICIAVFVAVMIPLNFSIVKDDQSYVLFCTHYVFSNSRTCTVLWHETESLDDSSYDSESIFSQKYQISILQNTKTMKQYVSPDFITIGPGSKVLWYNSDKTPVTINSNDPDNPWSTGVILPDEYVTVTFDEPGIYEYHGRPGTDGIIVVMDDDGTPLTSEFSEVFGNGSPLVYNDGMRPVFLYDSCNRYAYWLNEHGKEKIDLPEDYPRYPPWGNQIFPLVEFCTSNGELVKTMSGNTIRWEFRIENEN